MAFACYFSNNIFYRIICHILLAACFFLFFYLPASAQIMADNSQCRLYEQQLQDINQAIRLNKYQVARYQQLAQMQQQARRDAARFGCHAGLFGKGSNSEECRYIRHAQQRLETAMNMLGTQAATAQQKRMRQMIYKDMQYYKCRSPQALDRLIAENRNKTRQPARKRTKQTYKKPQPIKQAALQKPVAPLPVQEAGQRPASPMPVQEADILPIKANAGENNSALTIPPSPAMNFTKTAETPPPPMPEPVDYVPDPKIRRVGPEYYPAR